MISVRMHQGYWTIFVGAQPVISCVSKERCDGVIEGLKDEARLVLNDKFGRVGSLRESPADLCAGNSDTVSLCRAVIGYSVPGFSGLDDLTEG